MIIADHYKDYVGAYVKRFYQSFKEDRIYQIKDYRRRKLDSETIKEFKEAGHKLSPFIDEYLYSNGAEEWWTDCEDSCIITNELPIKDIDWVANVNDSKYSGYNPYTKQFKE